MRSIGTYDHRRWTKQRQTSDRPPRPDCSPGPWLPIPADRHAPAEPGMDFEPTDFVDRLEMLFRVYWYDTGVDLCQPHDQDDVSQDFYLWGIRYYLEHRQCQDAPASRVIRNFRARQQLRYLVESRFYRTNPPLPVYTNSEDQEKDLDRLRVAQAIALQETDTAEITRKMSEKLTTKRQVYRYC